MYAIIKLMRVFLEPSREKGDLYFALSKIFFNGFQKHNEGTLTGCHVYLRLESN